MLLHEMIDNIPMCKNFSEEEKKIFVELDHSILNLKKGAVIIKQGEKLSPAYPLYVLINGTVLVEKDGYRRSIATLEPGAIFGEMSFLSNKPRSSDVIANEDVLVIKMDNDFFQKINYELKDKIKNYLIEVLIERLNNVNESLKEVSNVARGLRIKKEYGE